MNHVQEKFKNIALFMQHGSNVKLKCSKKLISIVISYRPKQQNLPGTATETGQRHKRDEPSNESMNKDEEDAAENERVKVI